jgi:deoxyhypusine monooxygenase
MRWVYITLKIYLYSSDSHNMLIRLIAIVQAAEALGAIGLESNIPLLKNSLALDPAQEVKETCELALNRIEQLKDASCQSMDAKSPFMSVDPAAPATSGSSVNQLRCV